MESVPADTPNCPPDVEDIAEAYCMETLDRPASLAFENHYLACARCASVVASTRRVHPLDESGAPGNGIERPETLGLSDGVLSVSRWRVNETL